MSERNWETVATKGAYLYQIAARGDGIKYEARRISDSGKGKTAYGVYQSKMSATRDMQRKAGASLSVL